MAALACALELRTKTGVPKCELGSLGPRGPELTHVDTVYLTPGRPEESPKALAFPHDAGIGFLQPYGHRGGTTEVDNMTRKTKLLAGLPHFENFGRGKIRESPRLTGDDSRGRK